MFKKTIYNLWVRAIPLFYGGMLITFMSLLEGIYLAKYSDHALNALLLTVPLITIINSVAAGLGSAISKNISKSNSFKEKAKEIYMILFLVLIIGIVIILCGYFFEPYIISLYDLNSVPFKKELLLFTDYWNWLLPSFLIQLLITIIIQVLVTEGKVKEANLILLTITLINILLSPLLIFSFNLGIIGAAISTNVAFCGGCIASLVLVNKQINKIINNFLIVKETKISVFLGIFKSQIKTSLSVFCAISVFSIGAFYINQLALKESMIAITVLGIAEQLKTIFSLTTRGVAGAYLIEFGRDLSRKNYLNYYKTYWAATFIIGVIYLVGVILFVVFPGLISKGYNLTELKTINLLKCLLLLNSIILIIEILPRAAQIGFLNLNKEMALFLQSGITVLLSCLMAKYLMPIYGIYGIVYGQIIGVFITSIMFLSYFYFLLNKQVKFEINSKAQ